jgi:hypothetical protein
MRKIKFYRIVKVESTCITKNTQAFVDFIPELYLSVCFQVEEKIGLFGKWKTVLTNISNKDIAKTYLTWYKSKPKKIVIK